MLDKLLELLRAFWAMLQGGQLPHLGNWNYILLALLVAIEGPLATLVGAAAAAAGFMRANLVFVAAAAGNLTADILWYSVGYAGKVDWLLRYGGRFGLRMSHLERLRQGMHSQAPKILMLAKLTAAFTIPSLIAAGLARVPLRRWLPGFLAAETVWTGGLVLIGYYATEAIARVESGMKYVIYAGGFLFVLIVFELIRRSLRQSKAVRETIGSDSSEG